MVRVELYSKEHCHLCERAKAVLYNVRKRHPFELKEIMIQEGDEFFDRFKERIPVVFIDKEFAFQYRVPEKEFIAKLKDIK
jgi:glutaredoxin